MKVRRSITIDASLDDFTKEYWINLSDFVNTYLKRYKNLRECLRNAPISLLEEKQMIEQEFSLLYGDEPKFLQRYATKRRIIEIGSYHGFSTCLMSDVAEHVLAIDTFQADNIPGMLQGVSTFHQFCENIKGRDNIEFIVGNSTDQAVCEQVPHGYFDMLFVDGDHSYDGCLADLVNYVPKLRPGSPVVLHDYGNPQFTGVMAATMNFFQRWPDDRCLGLAVFYT